MTYFDHDHRKGENIRFLAACHFLLQDLRSSPARGMPILMGGAQYRIQVLSDLGETKIRDAYTTGAVYKDVLLARCEYSGEMKSRTTAYSFEVPMNHITGVEITEALGGVG